MPDWFRHPLTWAVPLILLALVGLTAAKVVIEVNDTGRVTVTDPDQRVELRREVTAPPPSDRDTNEPVAFGNDAPVRWSTEQPFRIRVETPDTWPSDADVLVLAWSERLGAMVEGFAERFERGPVELTADQLAALPTGPMELQALWRSNGAVQAMARHRLDIEPAATDGDAITNDRNAADAAPTRDDDGFTVWPLHPDARTVYVAAAGDDGNSGFSPNDPIRTLRRAATLLRDRRGDHLKLRAGDTFHGGFGTWSKSGHDLQHPLVIGVYGDGDRPTILTTGAGLLRTDSRRRIDFVALQGLRIIAARRDPARPQFDPDRIPYRESAVSWFASGRGLHVEDCVFERFMFHFVLQHDTPGAIRDVTIRRCVLADAYSHWDGDRGGHSSGVFATGVTGLRIDECVIDHNGWAPRADGIEGAGRTKFNHNLYLQQKCADLAVTNNVIARGASYGLQLRPGGRCEGNLFARNTHGLYLAVSPSVVVRNVVAESTDLNDRPNGHRGYGIVIWPVEHALVEHNLLLHKRGSAAWAPALEVTTFGDWSVPVPGYRVTFRHNTVVGWPRGQGQRSLAVYDRDAEVTEVGNVFDRASGGMKTPRFADPNLTLDDAAGGDFEAWLTRARQRPRGTWNPALTAAHLNDKLSAAYTVRP